MRELLEKVSNLRMDKPLVGSEIHGFHTMQGIAAFSKEKKIVTLYMSRKMIGLIIEESELQ